MSKISICYLTNRPQPMFKWFVDSLCNQVKDGDFPQVIFIDFMLTQPGREERIQHIKDVVAGRFEYGHHEIKPCVWQGPHRLTKTDYFAAANARNTGLCYAKGDYILFVDDLSILLPGWLDNAKHAARSGYCVQGSYRKVKNLVVEQGIIKSFDPVMEKQADGSERDVGMDCRWGLGSDSGIVPSYPSNMYGCSFGCPTEAMLRVNGQDEIFDGCGYEDSALGFCLVNNGYKLFYNRNLCTYESHELHFQGKPLLREDPGVSPNDASHTLYYGSSKFPAPSQFQFVGVMTEKLYKRSIGTKQDLRKLREHILGGGQFPEPTQPSLRWYDSVPLADLPQNK